MRGWKVITLKIEHGEEAKYASVAWFECSEKALRSIIKNSHFVFVTFFEGLPFLESKVEIRVGKVVIK